MPLPPISARAPPLTPKVDFWEGDYDALRGAAVVMITSGINGSRVWRLTPCPPNSLADSAARFPLTIRSDQ